MGVLFLGQLEPHLSARRRIAQLARQEFGRACDISGEIGLVPFEPGRAKRLHRIAIGKVRIAARHTPRYALQVRTDLATATRAHLGIRIDDGMAGRAFLEHVGSGSGIADCRVLRQPGRGGRERQKCQCHQGLGHPIPIGVFQFRLHLGQMPATPNERTSPTDRWNSDGSSNWLSGSASDAASAKGIQSSPSLATCLALMNSSILPTFADVKNRARCGRFWSGRAGRRTGRHGLAAPFAASGRILGTACHAKHDHQHPGGVANDEDAQVGQIGGVNRGRPPWLAQAGASCDFGDEIPGGTDAD